MYDVRDSIPVNGVSELDPGTNLLIAGPSMVGKRELTLDLLAAGHENGEGMSLVMTSESAAVVIADLDRRHPTTLDRERIGVIDCMGNENRRIIDDVATQSLSSPDDLVGISTGTARVFRYLSDRGVSEVRHGLVSVSTLLQHLDLDTVFKFLCVYTNGSRRPRVSACSRSILPHTNHR